MIIDIHRHMWSMDQRYRAAFAGIPGREPAPITDFDWQQTTDEIVTEMASAGVDRSVLFVSDSASRLGDPPFSIEEENQFVAWARDRYPDKITAFFGIDPRRPAAADSYERAITEWRVTGLKLHPTVGYYPHDRACYPLYELCVAHGLPVLLHSGPMPHPRLYSRFTHPLEFDEVAADFPDLTIILGHAGGEWWTEAVTIARSHPNILLELSCWQTDLKDDPEKSVGSLSKMISELGAERVFWGSDFPSMRKFMPLKESLEVFQQLPHLAKQYRCPIPESALDLILGGNADRALDLTRR